MRSRWRPGVRRPAPRWLGLTGAPLTVSVMGVLSDIYNARRAANRPRLGTFLAVERRGWAAWCGAAPGSLGGSGSRGGGHFHRGRRRVMGARETIDMGDLAVVAVRRRRDLRVGRNRRVGGPQ